MRGKDASVFEDEPNNQERKNSLLPRPINQSLSREIDLDKLEVLGNGSKGVLGSEDVSVDVSRGQLLENKINDVDPSRGGETSAPRI